MFGICMSAIRQSVSFTHDDCKYASAEANVRAVSPRDFTSISKAERNKSSSSTMDMSGNSANRPLPLLVVENPSLPAEPRCPRTGRSKYTTWVLGILFFLPPNAEVLGNEH